MNDAAEQALAYHIESHKLFSAVAAVFEHHTVDTGFLVCTDETEAILDVICSADLGANLLTCTHCRDAHFDVRFPSGENENCLYLGMIDNLTPIGRFEGTDACLSSTAFAPASARSS